MWRSPTHSTPSGVRGRAALPRETLCYISFDKVGTQAACFGVGTSQCKLRYSDLCPQDEYLFEPFLGQDKNSWTSCFSAWGYVSAWHKGHCYDVQDLSGKAGEPRIDASKTPLVFRFLISSGQMLVTLPHGEELVVPFGIPNLEIFAVASACEGTISISSSLFGV